MLIRIAFVAALTASLFAERAGIAQTGGAPVNRTICVALARSEISADADFSAPLRDAIVDSLRGVSLTAVPIDAGMDGALAQAAQKSCAYLVLTRVQSHGGGAGGFMQRHLPGKSNSTAPRMTQQPGDAVSLTTAEQTAIKRGDSITLEYQLTPGSALKPISSAKLDAKAQADGADVLGPMVFELTNVVSTMVASGSGRPTAASASGNSSNDGKRSRGNNASGSPQGGPPANFSCEDMAAQTRGTISVESCKQMLGAQQKLTAAANDPSAARPGDENMTCDQIAAEMKQQQFSADKTKLADAQTAMTDFQNKTAEQQKEVAALVAKETAEQSLLSTVVPVNAVAAAEAKRVEQEQRETNERMAKESKPLAEKAIGTNAALVSDVADKMAANPRMARLAQLAMTKKCKGQ
jgi:hypothetical protein